jgi:hypothetical protein
MTCLVALFVSCAAQLYKDSINSTVPASARRPSGQRGELPQCAAREEERSCLSITVHSPFFISALLAAEQLTTVSDVPCLAGGPARDDAAGARRADPTGRRIDLEYERSRRDKLAMTTSANNNNNKNNKTKRGKDVEMVFKKMGDSSQHCSHFVSLFFCFVAVVLL